MELRPVALTPGPGAPRDGGRTVRPRPRRPGRLVDCLLLLLLAVAATPAAPGKRVVYLDPGHGGDDNGIKGVTVLEKNLVMQLAERLRLVMSYAYNFDVRLTRSGDTPTPLFQRASLANTAGADLFVSLHCAVSHRKDDKGFLIYFYRPSSADTTKVEIPRGIIEGREIRFAPLNQAQVAWQQSSLRLAEQIQERLALAFSAFCPTPLGERLFLLATLNCPAVLIEVCFLGNAEEEKSFTNSRVQDDFCKRVADALGDFLQ